MTASSGDRVLCPAGAAAAHAAKVIESAATIRLPELFERRTTIAVDRIHNRHGISVATVRSGDLTRAQLLAIMRFRLAQYLAVGFVDPQWAHDRRTDHESLSGTSADDVHLLAGSAMTGEILAYGTMRGSPDDQSGTTLRSRNRSLYPAEEVHGWGVFNRLRMLPDLPTVRVRELGRFIKNQRLSRFDELSVRAPIELLAAFVRLVTTGALRGAIDAVVGDFEETVLKRNFDYFHIPTAVIRGTVPYEPASAYMCWRYVGRDVFPSAASVDDVWTSLPRLHAIERALELPGAAGIRALVTLKRDGFSRGSELIPSGGLPALADASLPQRSLTMSERRDMIETGDLLRATVAFHDLTRAEAAVAGTLMSRRAFEPGGRIAGRPSADMLYVIESGKAEMRDGAARVMLGPADWVARGILDRAGAGVQLVAVSKASVLCMPGATYRHYVQPLLRRRDKVPAARSNARQPRESRAMCAEGRAS